ncbi:MAG: hypothetical protein LBC98_08095 [Prevotellaceae bacterium]|jgi:hypothetical protein|nr:hypothetical protein [Prevotellaceae bacterium]
MSILMMYVFRRSAKSHKDSASLPSGELCRTAGLSDAYRRFAPEFAVSTLLKVKTRIANLCWQNLNCLSKYQAVPNILKVPHQKERR